MKGQKIELPPLPDLLALQPEVFDRGVKVVSETMAEQLMQDYARAAIEADRKRRGEPVGWQPIETAPKDKAFLAVLSCGGVQTICTMRWPVAEAKNSRPDGGYFHVERVTHWMPLPAAPQPANPIGAPTLHNKDSGAQDGIHAPQPAEQQTDVAQLLEALTELCDEIDKHEIHAAISTTNISWFKRKARKALSAHRKQGVKQ